MATIREHEAAVSLVPQPTIREYEASLLLGEAGPRVTIREHGMRLALPASASGTTGGADLWFLDEAGVWRPFRVYPIV